VLSVHLRKECSIVRRMMLVFAEVYFDVELPKLLKQIEHASANITLVSIHPDKKFKALCMECEKLLANAHIFSRFIADFTIYYYSLNQSATTSTKSPYITSNVFATMLWHAFVYQRERHVMLQKIFRLISLEEELIFERSLKQIQSNFAFQSALKERWAIETTKGSGGQTDPPQFPNESISEINLADISGLSEECPKSPMLHQDVVVDFISPVIRVRKLKGEVDFNMPISEPPSPLHPKPPALDDSMFSILELVNMPGKPADSQASDGQVSGDYLLSQFSPTEECLSIFRKMSQVVTPLCKLRVLYDTILSIIKQLRESLPSFKGNSEGIERHMVKIAQEDVVNALKQVVIRASTRAIVSDYKIMKLFCLFDEQFSMKKMLHYLKSSIKTLLRQSNSMSKAA